MSSLHEWNAYFGTQYEVIARTRTETHTPHWLISEANSAFPQCRVIYHCGPGTALQGLILWTRQASEGKQRSSPELKRKKKKNTADPSSGNERQRGPLGYLFPPLYLSFHPLCYTFALFAKKGRSSLTEEVMTQGEVCRLCGWNY